MNKIFKSTGTFFRAAPHFLIFELLYRLILLAIGAPVLVFLLNLTMKAAKISYLTDENLLIYLQHPAPVLVIIMLLFCAAFFTFVELSALSACFACCSKHKRITAGAMFLTGINAFKKAFRGSGILSFTVFMLFMPVVQFTIASGVFMVPIMPILRNIFGSVSNAASVTAFILLQILLVIVFVSRCYSLHYLVLTERPFKDGIKRSRELIHGRKIKMIVTVLLWSFSMLAAAAIVTFALSFIIMLFVKGFSRPESALKTAFYVLKYAGQVLIAVSAFFSAPVIMFCLTEKFLADSDDDEKLVLPDLSSSKMRLSTKTVLFICISAATIALNYSYLKALYKGNVSINAGILGRTQVSAHRGFSYAAPENTLYAFEAAINCGADYIELDVQLTADGQLVVFHDKTLNRTTNGEGNLSDYTYDELQQLTAAARFTKNPDYADAKIPLLTDVLDLYGDDILWNIEIKNFGNVKETAQKVVETVEEHGLTYSCYVTSFSYPALKKVKELNPKIKTALIANFAASTAYSQLKYIDAVSMNYIFVNQSVVNTVHRGGKRIFVWTVDKQVDMRQMMRLGVDNIITNRPNKAIDVVYSNSVGETILTVLEFIFGQ